MVVHLTSNGLPRPIPTNDAFNIANFIDGQRERLPEPTSIMSTPAAEYVDYQWCLPGRQWTDSAK